MTRLGLKRYPDGRNIETAPFWFGKEARAIRAQIHAEQAEALARYDAERTPENLAAFASLADTETEVGKRLASLNSKARRAA